MGRGYTTLMKSFFAIGALLGWAALAGQFYFAMDNRMTDITEAVIRFVSYFTILANGLAALSFTVLLLRPVSAWGQWFGHPSTLTAVTVYLVVVGIIYNVILRGLWNPQGPEMIIDESLHSAMPALFLLFWVIFVAPRTLSWKSVPVWMIFPLVYCAYTLVRGAKAQFYPYPFLDVLALGRKQVFLNIGGMILLFFALAFCLVGFSKLVRGKE